MEYFYSRLYQDPDRILFVWSGDYVDDPRKYWHERVGGVGSCAGAKNWHLNWDDDGADGFSGAFRGVDHAREIRVGDSGKYSIHWAVGGFLAFVHAICDDEPAFANWHVIAGDLFDGARQRHLHRRGCGRGSARQHDVGDQTHHGHQHSRGACHYRSDGRDAWLVFRRARWFWHAGIRYFGWTICAMGF